MTFNTGNPIGSTDSRDRLDNTENMDYLENSTTELTRQDRLGTVRKTRHGMEVEHDAQISAHESEHDAQMQSFENDFDGRLAGMAFTRVGSFSTGATLTDMRQALIWEVSQGGDGHEYGWVGAFPKVVAAGSAPATSGGIGAGAWVDRTSETLRNEFTATGASISDIAIAPVYLNVVRYFDDARVNYGFNSTVNDNYAALSSFVASENKNIVISEPYKINQSITIPKSKNLYFIGGGKLISTAGTLTVNAKVCADSTPIEANGGAVLVSDYAISVGTSGDFTTIQDAVNSVPSTQWQRFNIRIAEGTYDEDVVIANKWAASYTIGNAGGERTGLYVYGVNRTNVLIKSCSMIGSGGASFTPAFGVCTLTGANTKTNEDASFEAYGCPSAAIIDVQFSPSVSHDKAIVSYGSVLSVEKVDFTNDKYADFFTTKHGGVIQQNGNKRLGIYESPTGRCSQYIANPVSGNIYLMDGSGLSSSATKAYRFAGSMNGITYNAASRSFIGPSNFRDILSTYQTYFTNLSDCTIYNYRSGVAAIDETKGLSLTPAASSGSYSSAYIRRTHAISSQQICFDQQLLVAAILPSSMSGVEFTVGIGGSIYFKVDGTNITGNFKNENGDVTSVIVTSTSNILGDNCVFNILVERNNTTTSTSLANVLFRVKTDTFEDFATMLSVSSSYQQTHEWAASMLSTDGSVQTVYLSELRLYRE